ncbi:hypothetical protein KBD81_03830 [Candidatus Woesebacteria bacterium]|nr:hypothetical protein [Candidatus Woesebacteria bacterium]
MSREVQHTPKERASIKEQLRYVIGLQSQEQFDNHLQIGKEFFPSSLLSPEERTSELHATGYSTLINNPLYIAEAQTTPIVLHTMDAGLGNNVNRDLYLEEMKELLWDRAFLEGQKGAKSMDLYLFWLDLVDQMKDQFRSIADIKIHRAIHQAHRYAGTHIEVLVNNQSLPSMQGIYDRYKEVLLAHGIEVSFKVEEQLPLIDIDTQRLNFDQTSPGGHGYAGRLILDDIRTSTKEKCGSVGAIYNGDGVNNGISPELVGFIKKKKAAFVLLSTTRTPADVKGGIIGLKKTESGGRVPYLMELAQANGQSEDFAKIGVSDDAEIAGQKHYKGEQYFNTNTVLLNEDLLHDFLDRIYKEMKEEEYNRIVSPEFMRKTKKSDVDDKEYLCPEGALGSLVFRLNEEVHTNDSLRQMWKEVSGDSEFLQIVNVEEEYREELFTPVKYSSDFYLQEYSDRYYLETDPSSERYATLVSQAPGCPLKLEGDLINSKSYYGSVWNLIHSFGFARMRELKSLDIKGAISCPDAIWKGNVRIVSEWKGKSTFILDQYYLKR